MDVLDWLLGGDPAVRWQALRDLTDAAPVAVAAERARVAREGLGAALLARQGADGAWHRDGDPTWVSTLYSSRLLRETGIDPGDPVVDAAMSRLASGFHWHQDLGGKPYFAGETEPCINGGTLAVGAHFGRPDHALARRLLGEQLADGGWNCEAPKSTRSSFHTTICVLEGLLAYERATGAAPEVATARRRGEAYLLERALYRRRSTGEVADPTFVELTFPTRYHYDVVRALDHLRAAGDPPDPRVGDAVQIVRDRRRPDGTWALDASYPDGIPVPLDEAVGEPSRWITLRALRVLRWYEGAPLA